MTVVVVGEPSSDSGEASSRTMLGLPGHQLALVRQIAATGKPYVVVLMNGRPLTIDWLAANAPALLEAWYPGTEGGDAVADILFGKVDPSGKLPMSFPVNVGQIPISYNELPTGRPYDPTNKYTSRYLDAPNAPQYPFGYGLSYTTFSLSIAAAVIDERGTERDADGHHQRSRTPGSVGGCRCRAALPARERHGILQPVEKLEGFQRVTLSPGQTQDGHVHARKPEPRLLQRAGPVRGRTRTVRPVGRRQLDGRRARPRRSRSTRRPERSWSRPAPLIGRACPDRRGVVVMPLLCRRRRARGHGRRALSAQQRAVLLRDRARYVAVLRGRRRPGDAPAARQPRPRAVRGEYTSAANVGVYLWAVVAAHDLGLIDHARPTTRRRDADTRSPASSATTGSCTSGTTRTTATCYRTPAGRLHRDHPLAGQLLVRLRCR